MSKAIGMIEFTSIARGIYGGRSDGEGLRCGDHHSRLYLSR